MSETPRTDAVRSLPYPNCYSQLDILARELERELTALRDEVIALRRDAKRLDWLENNLFDRYWMGNLNETSFWRMQGPYRHALQKLKGNTFRAAIDAAITERGEQPSQQTYRYGGEDMP